MMRFVFSLLLLGYFTTCAFSQDTSVIQSFNIKKIYKKFDLNIENFIEHNLILTENNEIFFIKGKYLYGYNLQYDEIIDSVNYYDINKKYDFNNKKILLCSDKCRNINIISYSFDYSKKMKECINIVSFNTKLNLLLNTKTKLINDFNLNFEVQYFSMEENKYILYSIFHNAIYKINGNNMEYKNNVIFDFYNNTFYDESNIDSTLFLNKFSVIQNDIVIAANKKLYIFRELENNNISISQIGENNVKKSVYEGVGYSLSGIYTFRNGFYWFTTDYLYFVGY